MYITYFHFIILHWHVLKRLPDWRSFLPWIPASFRTNHKTNTTTLKLIQPNTSYKKTLKKTPKPSNKKNTHTHTKHPIFPKNNFCFPNLHQGFSPQSKQKDPSISISNQWDLLCAGRSFDRTGRPGGGRTGGPTAPSVGIPCRFAIHLLMAPFLNKSERHQRNNKQNTKKRRLWLFGWNLVDIQNKSWVFVHNCRAFTQFVMIIPRAFPKAFETAGFSQPVSVSCTSRSGSKSLS